MKGKTWQYLDISAMHIELSNKCNAACPMCARYVAHSPNVDPNLNLSDVSYEQFVKWFPPQFLLQIRQIIFCGTHGDPITCRDLLEIVEYVCEHSNANIQINTNGGLRGAKFFSRLGELLNAKKYNEDGIELSRYVVFSIDGLEGVNQLYRRQVDHKKLTENVIAYAQTGAKGVWDFLKFKHNIHQLEEAEELSKRLGFEFRPKNPFGVDSETSDFPVMDKNYEVAYSLQHHEKPVGTISDEWQLVKMTSEAMVPYDLPMETKDTGCIKCFSFRMCGYPYEHIPLVEIYVSAQGHVLPCCFVANGMYRKPTFPTAKEVQMIQENVGDRNSLHHHTLREIIDHNKTLKTWSDSWKDMSIVQCWNQCGYSKEEEKVRIVDDLFDTLDLEKSKRKNDT